ncbi:toll/interleukin-1 receptor domain-containing protein [Cryptosporangium japonicum]|uniref:TIR domain-containing protein n=1 Tax=Cryptosporangium japonicum TaxID=80872 RepID=A0ABP3EP77_9ACTN
MAPGDATLSPRWDIAFSYAAAQRPFVEAAADHLDRLRIRYFLDTHQQTALWGRPLPEELNAIYGERTATVVALFSADYAKSVWARTEMRAALDRAIHVKREFFLPARFDDTPIEGLPSGLVTLDLRGKTPLLFAEEIANKLVLLGVIPPAPRARPGVTGSAGFVPTSVPDLRRLGEGVARKLIGWVGQWERPQQIGDLPRSDE